MAICITHNYSVHIGSGCGRGGGGGGIGTVLQFLYNNLIDYTILWNLEWLYKSCTAIHVSPNAQ